MLFDKRHLSLIDANINRLLEGLRVCEEVMRFITRNRELTLNFKKMRHTAAKLVKKWRINNDELLNSRNSRLDVGKDSISSELKRRGYMNIFTANIQRAKESLRVLEEFSKLNNKEVSAGFKKIRYKLYELEKNSFSEL